MTKKQHTKKEHYVPQFYLRNFTNEKGSIWVYDRETKKTFSQTPANVCFENDLYETKAEEMNPALGDYVLRNYIEDALRDYEGEWSTVLNKILRVCRQNVNRDALICNTEEKRILAQFVANLILRNPRIMEHADLDEISEAMRLEETKAYSSLFEQLGIGKIDSLIRYINKSNHFNNEFGSQKQMADDLIRMKISFIFNDKNDFVTSSFPVFCGIRNNTADVMVPLSPAVLLLYGFEDMKKLRRNRMGFNSVFPILLKFLYLHAYSPQNARFLIARRKEDLINIDNPERLKESLMSELNQNEQR